MKHINKTILFMALAAAAFTACDDDEDPAFAPEVTISRAEGSTSCVPGTTYELTAQTTESVDTLCWLLDGGKVSDAASYTFTAAVPACSKAMPPVRCPASRRPFPCFHVPASLGQRPCRNGNRVPLTWRRPCVGGVLAAVLQRAYTFHIRFIYVLSTF